MRAVPALATVALLLPACTARPDRPAQAPVPLAVEAHLATPTVSTGGTVVVTLTATNPGPDTIRVTAPSSCVATAQVIDSAGRVVATPTMLCSEKPTRFRFNPGLTSQWDVGLDVTSPPGNYRVVARLVLPEAAALLDTLPLTVR